MRARQLVQSLQVRMPYILCKNPDEPDSLVDQEDDILLQMAESYVNFLA